MRPCTTESSYPLNLEPAGIASGAITLSSGISSSSVFDRFLLHPAGFESRAFLLPFKHRNLILQLPHQLLLLAKLLGLLLNDAHQTSHQRGPFSFGDLRHSNGLQHGLSLTLFSPFTWTLPGVIEKVHGNHATHCFLSFRAIGCAPLNP